MRKLLAAVLAVVLVASAPPALHAQETNAQSVVEAVYATLNDGDTQAHVDLYAADAVVSIGLSGTYTGTEEILAWTEPQIENHAYVEYEILEVDGNRVVVAEQYASDDLPFALQGTGEFVVEDGLVVSQTWLPSEETAAMLASLMSPFQDRILDGIYGITGQGTFFIPDSKTGEVTEMPAVFVGIITADGQGGVKGTRLLNGGGKVNSDVVAGEYKINADGALTFVLNTYQDNVQTAEEYLTCYVLASGETFECMVTRYTAYEGGSKPVEVPVVGLVHGQRMGDAP